MVCSVSDPNLCARINAILVTKLNSHKKIVTLSPHCKLTRGHPVKKNGEKKQQQQQQDEAEIWIRADRMEIPVDSMYVESLYNFELEQPYYSVILDGQFECATVGKSFPSLKPPEEEDSMATKIWGDSYWSILRPQFLARGYCGNVTYIVA